MYYNETTIKYLVDIHGDVNDEDEDDGNDDDEDEDEDDGDVNDDDEEYDGNDDGNDDDEDEDEDDSPIFHFLTKVSSGSDKVLNKQPIIKSRTPT